MSNNQQFFIYILSKYLNNQNIDIKYNFTCNFSELLDIAYIHNLTGILAAICRKEKICLDDNYTKILDENLFISVRMSLMWNKLHKEVTTALAFNKIKNITVKGPIIKKYYPDPDLRTMGDIDLVICKTDIPKAIKIMETMGFKSQPGCIDEYKFIRKDFCVELHEDLTSKDFGTGVDYKAEMQSLFYNVKKVDEYIQELTDEYHLIYLILHIAQHLISSGCGIRQIMDVAVMIKNVKLDYTHIWKELDRLELSVLAHYIFCLCHRWFGIKIDDYEVDEDIYEMLSNYIIKGGIFGYVGDRQNNLIIRESIYGSKIKTFIKRVFPSIEETKSKVIWFRNKSSLLLPFAWIYHWIDMCTENPQRVKNYFKFLFGNNKNEIFEEYQMFQALGFYKNR